MQFEISKFFRKKYLFLILFGNKLVLCTLLFLSVPIFVCKYIRRQKLLIAAMYLDEVCFISNEHMIYW